ncbi:MAG: glycoside hydrolase family 13 protein [Bacillota bacterium]
MEFAGFDGQFYCYEYSVTLRVKVMYLVYCFQFTVEDIPYWLSAYGVTREEPGKGLFEYIYTLEEQVPVVPQWANGAILYQIFPDRFRRLQAKDTGIPLREWNETPGAEGFYGGNLQGIGHSAAYLKNLGIEAIYLNPVFRSPSNHRYNTQDYQTVDPMLGTNDDLRELADRLHHAGIRLILDGVFNHCGLAFPPFQDVLEFGKQSRYRDWFYVDEYPVAREPPTYETIGYYSAMPKLRQSNPEVQDNFLAIAEKWTRELSLDGWRLDVADEMDPGFLRRLRQRLYAINPEILILGEAWQENTDMVFGGLAHGLINYPFYRTLCDYFALHSIDAAQFTHRISRALLAYPAYARDLNACMLECHDTPRFLTLCAGNPEKLRCALAFMLLYPGIDLIFYGLEAGITGGADPDCRKTMPWDHFNQDVFGMIKRFIRVRKKTRKFRAAIDARYLPLVVQRTAGGKKELWSIVNMEEKRRMILPKGEYRTWFGGEGVAMEPSSDGLQLTLEPCGCIVIEKE